jgi:protein-disulfide isomerase
VANQLAESPDRGVEASIERRRFLRSPWFPRVLLGVAAALLGWAIVALAVGSGGPQRFKLHGGNYVQETYAGVRSDGAYIGNPGAPVTISVFNDLQCSTCRKFQLHTVDPLVAEYARGSSARLEWHNYSLGPTDTTVAGLAAAAAGNQDYEWPYVDLFFRNQGQAGQRGVTPQFLNDIANSIPNLNVNQWDDDRGSAGVKARVDSDAKLAISLRLPAQPAIIVTGPGGTRKLFDSPTKGDVDAAVRAVS